MAGSFYSLRAVENTAALMASVMVLLYFLPWNPLYISIIAFAFMQCMLRMQDRESER
jgi:hypothetical protein